MGCTDTGSSVLDRLVGDGKFTKIVANHLWLNFNLVEGFAIIDTNIRTYHFRYNNHVSQMGLNNSWLFLFCRFELGFTKAFYKSHWLALKTTGESSTGACMKEIKKLVIFHLQQIIQLYSTERKFSECATLF